MVQPPSPSEPAPTPEPGLPTEPVPVPEPAPVAPLIEQAPGPGPAGQPVPQPPAAPPPQSSVPGIITSVPGIISSVPGTSSASQAPPRPVIGHGPPPGFPAFIPTAVPPRPVPTLALPDDVESTRLTGTARLSALAESAPPSATLRLWDDRKVTVTGVVLLGRNPTPRGDEPAPQRLIAVPDSGRSVSKTHLAAGVDASGVWVRDRHSTNGTTVRLPDGRQILCAGDQEVRVPVGGSVAFGEFWFTVV